MEEMKKSWQERLAEQESTNKVSIEPALEGLLDNLGRAIDNKKEREKIVICTVLLSHNNVIDLCMQGRVALNRAGIKRFI